MSTTISPAFVRFLAMAMATALDREQQRARLLGGVRSTRESPSAVPAQPIPEIPPVARGPTPPQVPAMARGPTPPQVPAMARGPTPPQVPAMTRGPTRPPQVPGVILPVVASPPPPVAHWAEPPVPVPPNPAAGPVGPETLLPGQNRFPEPAPEAPEALWPDLPTQLLAEAHLREALAQIIRDDALRHGFALREW